VARDKYLGLYHQPRKLRQAHQPEHGAGHSQSHDWRFHACLNLSGEMPLSRLTPDSPQDNPEPRMRHQVKPFLRAFRTEWS